MQNLIRVYTGYHSSSKFTNIHSSKMDRLKRSVRKKVPKLSKLSKFSHENENLSQRRVKGGFDWISQTLFWNPHLAVTWLTFPSLCSEVEQLSMKVCATTERQESTMWGLWISNTKSGFLIMFTQNLKGKLNNKKRMNEMNTLWEDILHEMTINS